MFFQKKAPLPLPLNQPICECSSSSVSNPEVLVSLPADFLPHTNVFTPLHQRKGISTIFFPFFHLGTMGWLFLDTPREPLFVEIAPPSPNATRGCSFFLTFSEKEKIVVTLLFFFFFPPPPTHHISINHAFPFPAQPSFCFPFPRLSLQVPLV